MLNQHRNINLKIAKFVVEKNHRTIDCFHKGQTDVSIVVKTIPFVNVQCFQIFNNWVTRWRCSQ